MALKIRRWIGIAGVILGLAALLVAIYVPVHDRMVREAIEKAAATSSADPTIQKLARAIAIVSTEDGRLNEMQAIDSVTVALAAWMEYDLKFGDVKTTQQMQREAVQAGLKTWRGDCKKQAVFISALLNALGIAHQVKVDHQAFYPVGHAWVQCKGFDLNPGTHSNTTPLPRIAPARIGQPGDETFTATLVILHQAGWERMALN